MKYLQILILLFCGIACQQHATSPSQSVSTTIDTVKVEERNEKKIVETPQDTIPAIDYDTTLWTEVIRLDESILLDLKYASDSNFVGEQMYECGRCFLRPEVARILVKVHQQLKARGLGLKMYDCYRPGPIQWKLWEKVPDRRYVADPRKGSMHNRGTAVDLTIVDSLGQELPMGTPYDFFGPEAYPAYQDLPEEVLANRKLLHQSMNTVGFKSIRTEWWHFSYNGKGYALADMLWKCY
jgi:D-alanyl-D-alanine dipeptidase